MTYCSWRGCLLKAKSGAYCFKHAVRMGFETALDSQSTDRLRRERKHGKPLELIPQDAWRETTLPEYCPKCTCRLYRLVLDNTMHAARCLTCGYYCDQYSLWNSMQVHNTPIGRPTGHYGDGTYGA